MKSVLFVAFGLLISCPLWAGEPAGIALYCKSGSEVFLLLGEDAGNERGWSTFGGGAKEGESLQETASRETHEETRGYFERDWLLSQIAEQTPIKSNGFHLFFVEVAFVPAIRITKNPVLDENDLSWKEMRNFAWVPVSDLEKALAGDTQKVDPLFLPTTAKTDFYWKLWLGNMEDAYRRKACPWTQDNDSVKGALPETGQEED